jgi:hypothetical protein
VLQWEDGNVFLMFMSPLQNHFSSAHMKLSNDKLEDGQILLFAYHESIKKHNNKRKIV